MEYLIELFQIINRFDALPPKIQEVLTSEKTISATHQIAQNHQLSEEQESTFNYLIGLTILGKLKYLELSEKIKEELLLDESTSISLAKQVDKGILASIANELTTIDKKLSEAENNNINILSQAIKLFQEENLQQNNFVSSPIKDAPSPAKPNFLSPSFKEKQSSSLPKTVHYSDLNTPIEPTFAEKPLPPSPLPDSSITQINSSNIVDLKEIPVEQIPTANKEVLGPNF